jgi:DNA polymerase I
MSDVKQHKLMSTWKFIDKLGEDYDKAVRFLSTLLSIGVDTETTGSEPITDKVLLISAGNTDTQFVFDVAKLESNLEPLLNVLANPQIIKIVHNAKFDYKFFRRSFGIALEPVFDTMIAEMLLLKGRKLQGFALDDIADKYLGVKMDKDIRKSFLKMVYGDSFTEPQLYYSAMDVAYLHKLREEQMRFIRKHGLEKVSVIEMATIPAIGDMELAGMFIDKVKWLKAEENAKAAKLTAMEKLNEFFSPIYGKDMFGNCNINYNSPKQLLPAIKSVVGKPAEGLSSTAEAALKEIDHPAIKALLAYREKEKRITTYGSAFLEYINPVTGRIHSDFSQLYTDTGRFSSANPNLQNIPREKVYREAFTSGDPDYRLITVDYSGMELRILADLSKEPKWIQVFIDKGDLHAINGSILYGVPIRKPGTNGPTDPGENYHLRQPAKSLNFGIGYGMGPKKLAREANLPFDKARELVSAFWRNFPSIKKFFDAHVAKCMNDKCVRCPYDGRLRWLDGFDLDNPKEQARVRNMCMNFPMQAGNATITKRALTRIREHLMGKDAQIVGTVHDEIIVRTHKDIADEIYKIVVDDMIGAAKEFMFNVPVEVEGKIDTCWSK